VEVFAVVVLVVPVRVRVRVPVVRVVVAVGIVVGVQVVSGWVDLQDVVVTAGRFSSEEGGIGLVIVLVPPRYLWKVPEQ